MQEKNDDYINLLPPEMVEKIVGYLKPNELVIAAMASKKTFFVNAERKLVLNKKVHDMSTNVAHGKQAEVEELLIKLPIVDAQKMLLTPVPFTDYSGRTFNCTAYEYAYWAKDTHMCRMLEQQMDADTKTAMLNHCEAIERKGLTYKQHGVEVKGSKHFDFTPLKTALNNYVLRYNSLLFFTPNPTAMKAALLEVGLAQRDVPIHVINEYCRRDRSQRLEFNEPTLPRVVTYQDFGAGENNSLFPLVFSDSSGPGVDFALFRGAAWLAWVNRGHKLSAADWNAGCLDLAAVNRLDEVRTADLTHSRENLRSAEPEQSRGMIY